MLLIVQHETCLWSFDSKAHCKIFVASSIQLLPMMVLRSEASLKESENIENTLRKEIISMKIDSYQIIVFNLLKFFPSID